MADIASEERNVVAMGGRIRWGQCAVLGLTCALVIGVYAWIAVSGMLEVRCVTAENTYYNLLVRGFRSGQLNLKTEVPPELARLANPYDPETNAHCRNNYGHPLHDLSYYNGKLYLYFGITPALVLFWPYVALTGHYLLHKHAVVIFFSAGFLVSAGLLLALWRRYFSEVRLWIIVSCVLALGLADFTPAVLERCDVYEVAISCGYAMSMLALAGIWMALHNSRQPWRWQVAASLAYGLAVGARPELLFGAIVLLAPVFQGWRQKRRAWPLLVAAAVPISLIGLGLMFYNSLRFANPLEFGHHYQLSSIRPDSGGGEFGLRYLWSNFRAAFLEPARWSCQLPYVHDIVAMPLPKGAYDEHSFGILTNIPLVWLALAAPLAWRNRTAEACSTLRWFLGAATLFFGICALTFCLYFAMCLRYEVEFAQVLVLLAVIGVIALEHVLAGSPVRRRVVRCVWGLLLVFSVAFNFFTCLNLRAVAHNDLGILFSKNGRGDEAILQFQEALAIWPDYPYALVNLGNSFLEESRLDEAISLFQKVPALAPSYAASLNGLGKALLQKGQGDEAIVQFQQALSVQPDDADVLNNLGVALHKRGDPVSAYIQFQKALDLRPDSPEAHNNIGHVLLHMGMPDEAIPHLRQSLSVRPADAETLDNLGQALLQTGRVDEALLLFQKALSLEPGFAEAHYDVSHCLLRMGRSDEALGELQETIALRPDYAEAQNNLGTCLLQRGRFEEALPHFQKAAALQTNYVIALDNLGACLLQESRLDDAAAQFQKALTVQPRFLPAQNHLAAVVWLLATSSDPTLRNSARALELAQRAGALTGGTNPIVLRSLAAALAQCGRFPEAVETARQALTLARTISNPGLAAALKVEMSFYESGRPYTENAPIRK